MEREGKEGTNRKEESGREGEGAIPMKGQHSELNVTQARQQALSPLIMAEASVSNSEGHLTHGYHSSSGKPILV